jgi:hypothetical protein
MGQEKVEKKKVEFFYWMKIKWISRSMINFNGYSYISPLLITN